MPFFQDDRNFVGSVLGGWELSGIVRWQSGSPLTITGNTSIGARRADLVGDPYADSENRLEYLNPAAFAPAPEGRRGNSTRGQFRGPALNVWDLSLRKSFAITGDVKLQIQADLFNAFNRTNLRYSAQTLNLSTSGFQLLNQAAPPRNVQLGFRLMF